MAAVAKVSSASIMPTKKFGRVVITLENVLIPTEKLGNSPSLQDGLDSETELDLRILGCELIQTSGILLKLPQVAMATGQVLFQRFYYTKSMVRYKMETTAMACVALASKIEESPMKIRDVINVFHHIKQVKNGKNIQPVILDSNYIGLKNQIVKAERRLLKELGFCCHVKHPHKIIIMYLRLLEAEHKKLAQSSWNYMNDALRTDVFVRHSPETIACACIWLAGRQLKIPLPENPPWYHVFRVTLYNIEEIAASILKLYTRKKMKLEVLEAKVEEIRREQEEARTRNKAVSSILATPKEVNSFSPASRGNTPSKGGHQNAQQGSPSRDGGHHARKKSSSERRKQHLQASGGSTPGSRSRSKSRSPSRHSRKKAKRSNTRSRSRTRSLSRDRDRYHGNKKKYSRTPSPAVTPPPRFIKNKEKGSIVRSVSRSRSRSRTRTPPPHRTSYDKYERISSDKYERISSGISSADKYDRITSEKYDKYEQRLSTSDKYAKAMERYEKDRMEKYMEKIDKMDKMEKMEKYKEERIEKRSSYEYKEKAGGVKYVEKVEKKKVAREGGKREGKKYYDNGYEKHHKSKKNGRQRSRSRENRRR